MSSLSEMPDLVMKNIIGFLDFRSVLTLRQVCRGFGNLIDNMNDSKLPDPKFTRVSIQVDADICLFYRYFHRPWHKFICSETENSRSFSVKTTNLENRNTVDVAIRDLELILKFQKFELNYLNLDILNSSQFSNVLVKLSNMFKKLNRKIKTKRLSIKSDSQYEIISLLSFADPQTLEYLDLFPLDENTEIQMDEIVKTEQWKNAKSIHCEFYLLKMTVEDICHLQRFHGSLLSITARDLDFLKKTYISSSIFEISYFELKIFNENEEISNMWGPAFSFGSTIQWYFRMKNSEEKILRIEINQDNDIQFNIIRMGDVPNGAIVHAYKENWFVVFSLINLLMS